MEDAPATDAGHASTVPDAPRVESRTRSTGLETSVSSKHVWRHGKSLAAADDFVGGCDTITRSDDSLEMHGAVKSSHPIVGDAVELQQKPRRNYAKLFSAAAPRPPATGPSSNGSRDVDTGREGTNDDDERKRCSELWEVPAPELASVDEHLRSNEHIKSRAYCGQINCLRCLEKHTLQWLKMQTDDDYWAESDLKLEAKLQKLSNVDGCARRRELGVAQYLRRSQLVFDCDVCGEVDINFSSVRFAAARQWSFHDLWKAVIEHRDPAPNIHRIYEVSHLCNYTKDWRNPCFNPKHLRLEVKLTNQARKAHHAGNIGCACITPCIGGRVVERGKGVFEDWTWEENVGKEGKWMRQRMQRKGWTAEEDMTLEIGWSKFTRRGYMTNAIMLDGSRDDRGCVDWPAVALLLPRWDADACRNRHYYRVRREDHPRKAKRWNK